MKARVVVAMSGGVDSSVAACLLKKEGYEVVGITMCFNLTDPSAGRRPLCCGPQAIEDARRVAARLGIRHYSLNMQKVLQERVIADFCSEYLKGRTPNPCVRCNQYIKFGTLLDKALSVDAKFLATGHYARVAKAKEGYQLKKAKDSSKDQSYFLYRLSQHQLRHALLPLGGFTKEKVRGLARSFKLPVAQKPASQEICFLPDADYRAFLKKQIRTGIKPGLIVDRQGNILGRHKGIAYYTIGQREGLGIARGFPLYITGIDLKDNLITVGPKSEALKSELLVKSTHFIQRPIKKKVVLKVKIRYNHKEARALIISFGSKIKIKFFRPQFAVTCGQSAVFYDGDIVVGGGIIDKVLG